MNVLNKNKGFSLIELVIILSIFTVAMTFYAVHLEKRVMQKAHEHRYLDFVKVAERQYFEFQDTGNWTVTGSGTTCGSATAPVFHNEDLWDVCFTENAGNLEVSITLDDTLVGRDDFVETLGIKLGAELVGGSYLNASDEMTVIFLPPELTALGEELTLTYGTATIP